MKLSIETATPPDASSLSMLHASAAGDLTANYGEGRWSAFPSERAVLSDMRLPKFSRIVIARAGSGQIIAALRLATKKPWAIDASHFTVVKRPLYLTGMVVHPEFQRQGIGRKMLSEAEAMAQTWPAEAIRLDAFDAEAGAGEFYEKCGYREVGRVSYKGNALIYFERVFRLSAG